MARQRQNQNQYSLPFEQAALPPSSEAAAIVHGHLPDTVPLSPTPKPKWPDEIDGVPIPRPLAESVARSVFGTEESGEPVDPSPEEVLAITRYHGERLTELLESERQLHEPRVGSSQVERTEWLGREENLRGQIQSVLALYAEDFGEQAARHFASWAARQLDEDGEQDNAESKEAEESASKPSPSATAGEPEAEPVSEVAVSPGPTTLAAQAESNVASTASTAAEVVDKSRPRIKARAVDRGERLDQIYQSIDGALHQLADSLDAGRSDALQNWLKTMSRFHNYSLNNQILIAFQCPDATHVAGFHAWKKFNRLVNKGEKGIMILAPVTRPVGKVEELDSKGTKVEKTLRKLVNTKTVFVFDISQTHGEPLPDLAKVTGSVEGHLDNLKELILSKGIELQFADRLPGGAQGLSQGGRIGCVTGLIPAEEFRTLVHELAHELLHRGERRQATTRRSRELEAESVAFVVCSAIGLDARQCSTDYIHLYRGDKHMLIESLQFIRQVSKEILSVLLPSNDDTRREPTSN